MGAVEARLAAHCRDEKRRRAVQFLAAHPGRHWLANEISLELGLGHEFVQRCLKAQRLVPVHAVGARRYVQASQGLVEAVRTCTEAWGPSGDGP